MAKPPNLLRKVQIDGAWKMLPVARYERRQGETRSDIPRYDLTQVMLAGVATVALEGTFYLEYRENGKRVRRSVGDHPASVKAALATQASVIGLRAQGVAVEDAPQLAPRRQNKLEGKTLRTVVEAFVRSPPLEYRHKTYLKYRNALETFLAWAHTSVRRGGGGKTHCVEIGRDEIKAFMSDMVNRQGLDVSTAVDKAVAVNKILRDQGAPIAMRKGDWPKVTKRQRELYRPETLKALFAACDETEFVLFQTFLMTGMREQELSHLHWENFDAARSTLEVKKKPGFDLKNYQERTVPIPARLVELLVLHRKTQQEQGRHEVLIFPTTEHNRMKGAPGGQADGHLLRKLKRVAFRAGLNCGRCRGRLNGKPVTCKTDAICREFGLHKFRHTYATTILRDGVDLLSLQQLLGHKDLDSTREYLRALEPEDLLKKINMTSLATRFV